MGFATTKEEFSLVYISYLVLQSVLQVVVVSLSGFWSAHTGLLPKEAQKIISTLNVDLFTPALIYSKMARQLSVAKVLEIIVIPIFFGASTLISYLSGLIVARVLQLDTDESNFVIGNSVFGNSNSLPVSLTLSLSYTLPNLLWDQIPNDTRDNVASRGLLYLLIFQQIGQMLRWSWGYNKLLKWSGENPHHMPTSQIQLLIEEANVGAGGSIVRRYGSMSNLSDSSGTQIWDYDDDEETFYAYTDLNKMKNQHQRETSLLLAQNQAHETITTSSRQVEKNFTKKYEGIINIIKDNLNPPLYSMIFGVIVACFPSLQHVLYLEGGFVNNSFSEAIEQIGSVSVPLILVVLGGNLYPTAENFPRTINHKKLVFGSLVGRMILPSILLLPLITLSVKYIGGSILEDPVFLIVGFLLTVAPPAIQLTQITQINEFFEAEMADLLFWGYVVLSLPVSIVVVSSAIYVLQWAND